MPIFSIASSIKNNALEKVPESPLGRAARIT
jgi:hypothetical protein